MKKFILIFIIYCGLCMVHSYAQGPPPPPPPPGPLGGGGTSVPIDNEVVLLLIATAAFGAWKLRKEKPAFE
jgi:hypothetical protein